MTKEKKFIDDEMLWIESDINKIQTKPIMYVNTIGRRAALHLAKEKLNNMIDECINKNSPGKVVTVMYDEKENTLLVADNGRGIPFENMIIACTKLQTGSKMTRSSGGKKSAGENGVGMTAINALSDKFELISYRYGEKASVQFERGRLVKDLTIEKHSNKKQHGTTAIFKPSEYFLGSKYEDCKFEKETLMHLLETVSYMLPKDITINFSANLIGKNAMINKTYTSQNGMVDVVNKMDASHLFKPVHVIKDVDFVEEYRGEKYDRNVELEFAFSFDGNANRTEDRWRSFCNFIETTDGGEHVDAVKHQISRFLVRETKKNLTEREASKFEITRIDTLVGLDLAVYLSTDMNPEFGQSKTKVSSKALVPFMRDLAEKGLLEYFEENPKVLKRCIDTVKLNAKTRVAASAAKEKTVKKERVRTLDEHEIANYEPARAKGKNDYRELIVMEGESAAGSVNDVRYKEFQATYGLRGYTPNAFKQDLNFLMANTQIKAITVLMRTGLGKHFKLDEVYFDKVIILTDGDSDGGYIRVLIMGFFIKYMRPFVEAGRLYIGQAPLYEIEDATHPFIRNKKEFIKVFEMNILKHMAIADAKTNKLLTEEEMGGFLLINRSYLEKIADLTKYYACHQDIIEFIAMYGEEKNFAKLLNKRFPELTYDNDGILSGVYEGRYQNVLINAQFNKRLESIRKLLVYGNGKAYDYKVYTVKDGVYTEMGTMTIGEFLRAASKYQPKIKHRFKGLGEIQPADLAHTTLDPNNRTLVQLTVSDIEEELARFELLLGETKDAKEQRKNLIQHFDIDIDDLDN